MATRKLIVEVIGDSKSVEQAFARSSKAATGFSATVTSTSRAVRNALAGAGVALGTVAIADQVRKAIGAASDLNEQVNKTNVVFGQSAQAIQAWAQTTAAAFGLSQRAALEAAAGFGQILETSGLTQQQAAGMSRSLVELAADIASFNNLDPSEALDKLRSGLAGEAEPLRRVGVLLSEARVKQEAYTSGIAESGAVLTEGQKVQARYALILRDTATAQGDFGRTSQGLANQQRILNAQIENLRAKLGEALLPAITNIVQAINRWLASSENQQRLQEGLARTLDVAGTAAKAFASVIRTIVPVVRGAVDAVGGLENALKLLAAAFVATKVARFIGVLDAVSTTAVGTTAKVNVLRTALLRLGAIGVITIGIEVLLNREAISKSVNEFLRSHNLGFFTGLSIDIPVNADLESLKRMRDQIAALKGDGDLLVQAFDKLIARQRELNNAAESGVSVAQHLADVLAGIGRKQQEFGPSPGVKGTAGDWAAAVPGLREFLNALGQVPNVARRAIDATLEQARALARLQLASENAALAVDRVGLALQSAQGTQTLTDDIAAYRQIGAALAAQEAAIRAQLKGHEDNLALQRQLITVQGQRIQNENALNAAIAQQTANQQQAAAAAREARLEAARAAREAAAAAQKARRDAEQRRQFRALGLSPEGSKPIPTIDNLTKQLNQLDSKITGGRQQGVLNAIRRVLTDPVHKATEETRAAIRDLFAAIRGELDSGLKGPITKTSGLNTKKIIEGLGLTPEQAQEVRSRLSGFNTAGRALAAASTATIGPQGFGDIPVNVTVNAPVYIDGEQVSRSVTKHQQKATRRNPKQKRGPNRIGGV